MGYVLYVKSKAYRAVWGTVQRTRQSELQGRPGVDGDDNRGVQAVNGQVFPEVFREPSKSAVGEY